MKNCGEIRENMSLYIDDELGAAERKAFEEHVAGCEACRNELEDITEIVSLCRETEEVELPADFRQKLHEKLVKASDAGKVAEIGAGMTKAAKRTRNIRYITSIAAGVVLIFLAGTFYNLGLFNSLKAGGLTSNSTGQVQTSPANSAEAAEPAAPGAEKKALAADQAANGAGGEAVMSAAAPSSETNRSASSKDRETQFSANNLAAADSDAIMSRNTGFTILVDDPAAQLDKVKNLALEYGGVAVINKGVNESTGSDEGSGTNRDSDISMTTMTVAPSDQIVVTYKVPTMSFDTFKAALDTQYGQANIQPGAVVSEDVTGKVNELIEQSNSLESQIEKLEADNDPQNAARIEELKAEKASTDAQIDQLRLDSDFTSIKLVIKKK